jgi:leader peptidase (prepilin peptidase)/N-methyltransferase
MRIGWFHPAVELAATTVALWAVLAESDPVRVWVSCGLGWTLLTVTWIDWNHFRLPDVLTLPLLLAGLTLTLAQDPGSLTDHCIATALAYLSFQGLAIAYRRLRGRDGLGAGDAKLFAAAGAWCGLAALPVIVLGSAVTGLLAALGLALAGRTMTFTTRIPFGPCIALAFWLVWIQTALADDLILWLGRH